MKNKTYKNAILFFSSLLCVLEFSDRVNAVFVTLYNDWQLLQMIDFIIYHINMINLQIYKNNDNNIRINCNIFVFLFPNGSVLGVSFFSLKCNMTITIHSCTPSIQGTDLYLILLKVYNITLSLQSHYCTISNIGNIRQIFNSFAHNIKQ